MPSSNVLLQVERDCCAGRHWLEWDTGPKAVVWKEGRKQEGVGGSLTHTGVHTTQHRRDKGDACY